jgi:hypothetical protein
MKTPSIAKLNVSEISQLMEEIRNNLLTEEHKEVLSETLEFCRKLIEDLKQSRINIHQLKQMLGFHSEQLKKGMLKK